MQQFMRFPVGLLAPLTTNRAAVQRWSRPRVAWFGPELLWFGLFITSKPMTSAVYALGFNSLHNVSTYYRIDQPSTL